MGSKRIKLDIGALTASSSEEGNFMFFLYRDGMDKCLAIPLNAPDMHAVLANFGQVPQKCGSIYKLFEMVSRFYNMELLEVSITRGKNSSHFESQMVFFDGEKEMRVEASFTDGVIMAKMFGCSIYIEEELMEQYATEVKEETGNLADTSKIKKTLEKQLDDAVNAEDYEKAEMIKEKLIFLNDASDSKHCRDYIK
jgi:uncharacterized protein